MHPCSEWLLRPLYEGVFLFLFNISIHLDMYACIICFSYLSWNCECNSYKLKIISIDVKCKNDCFSIVTMGIRYRGVDGDKFSHASL